MFDIGNDITLLAKLLDEGTILLLILISEATLWFLRRRIAKAYESSKKEAGDLASLENISITYYRKRQMLGIVRFSIFAVALLLAALIYDFQTFGVVALVLSALVVIQKENINSLIAYIFVLSNFKVGDDIKIGDMLGEIVRITPLQTVLSGKDENGEYNGRKIFLPNYKMNTEDVHVQELKSNTYRRIVVRAVYSNAEYTVDFAEFIERIRVFLDEYLPKRGLHQVGNFRNFAGVQYKLNFDYDEEGRIVVRIAFISRPHDALDRKEHLVEFIEKLRRLDSVS